RIEANDSLFKLAKRYYNDGSKWTEIYRANRNEMKDPHSLKIGQELFIPNITVSSKKNRVKIIKT
ncbi:MAG: LysM peptidoglycan-binding domain-containing protein, partial [Candidatus Brocadiaceae bacterium]|nr:LysM peptidoglycan-binding domain-containing protein [Candidatus Brocadiaceae bacterium]